VDVVDFRRGQELRFSNITTSSLFVFANLAPLAMESQQKFFQKSSKQGIGDIESMLFRILKLGFLLLNLIMQCKKGALSVVKKEMTKHRSLFLKGHHDLAFL